jgi:succinyl-CoA synthetase beta subunit
LDIHEYQAKEIMQKFGIKVPAGVVAESAEAAARAAADLGGSWWMVKAQIHAGGRGKAGGVRSAGSIDEVKALAAEILGKILVTHQTGPAGKRVHKILVEQKCDVDQEFYVGVGLDRNTGRLTFKAASAGGVGIEEIARRSPGKLVTASVDAATGFSEFMGRKLAFGIGIRDDQIKQAIVIFQRLYDLYITCDCTLAEINPLGLTAQSGLTALDAKISFDDNAIFRHPEMAAYRDPAEESPGENAAARHGLTYIRLDGNIGCLVNGAGLAMATLDIIRLHGGRPANFLDAGGRATRETFMEAFKIILGDNRVSAVLINIFAGILRCDRIAEGVVDAARCMDVKMPIVVRLEGTHAESGKKILESSGLAIIVANGLADAAGKAVKAAAG